MRAKSNLLRFCSYKHNILFAENVKILSKKKLSKIVYFLHLQNTRKTQTCRLRFLSSFQHRKGAVLQYILSNLQNCFR